MAETSIMAGMGMGTRRIYTSSYPSPYSIEKVRDSPYPCPYPVNAEILRQNGDGFGQYPPEQVAISTSSPKDYLLSQSKYIADLFERARLTDNKIVDTPLKTCVRYSSADSVPLTDSTLYRIIVGSLVYLTMTHPNIAHVVHVICLFVSAPTTVHWSVVLRVLRYLRGTQLQSLLLSSMLSLDLRTYCDADWNGDPNDKKFTTGWCICFWWFTYIMKE